VREQPASCSDLFYQWEETPSYVLQEAGSVGRKENYSQNPKIPNKILLYFETVSAIFHKFDNFVYERFADTMSPAFSFYTPDMQSGHHISVCIKLLRGTR
jgi:hypothetical protein